ncbi:hypothetical protein TNIN_21371 [Trichonephila inaurata madagascariensis]|uniref:Uncharacterized protein n=1 Tax=Trichonephila inaurata madagascariensis TaxID=2747483 RepID=A0A8X6YEG5_9ARAC|nr:hypothetical protein TNIN_21371 [Trichonephila inaurata madagascariensis]
MSSNHTKLSKNSGDIPKEHSLEGASSEMYLEDTAEMKQNVENIQGKQRKFASRNITLQGMFFLIFWISILVSVDCWMKYKNRSLISKEATWPEESSTTALFNLNSECLREQKNSYSGLFFDYVDKIKELQELVVAIRKTVKNAVKPWSKKVKNKATVTN